MQQGTLILIPFYNDNASLQQLLPALQATLNDLVGGPFQALVINDGSPELPRQVPGIEIPVTVLNLQRNIGHQKAIAVGMAWACEHAPYARVLIMDADGEDKPEDARLLLEAAGKDPGKIIFARRASRQEGNRFRFFYWLYKFFFRLLTGKRIAFGNFMVMPFAALEKAVHYSEIWSHVAGGILKAGLPYVAIETHRGRRYAGQSKMSFTALVLHGLGAIAVFMEVIATRLLLFSLLLIGLSLTAILVLVGIKAFTDYAIPGWTSTVVSAMLIVLLQSFLLSLFTIFLYLSAQTQRKFIPAHHYRDYTGSAALL